MDTISLTASSNQASAGRAAAALRAASLVERSGFLLIPPQHILQLFRSLVSGFLSRLQIVESWFEVSLPALCKGQIVDQLALLVLLELFNLRFEQASDGGVLPL